MRTILALLVGACATTQAGPHVSIEPDLADFLSWAQQQARTETVLCLTGSAEVDGIAVRGLRAPHVTRRDSISVHYDGCAGPGVIGLWHPHLAPFAYCEFSDVDRRSFQHSGLSIDLLSCGEGELRYVVRRDTLTRVLH